MFGSESQSIMRTCVLRGTIWIYILTQHIVGGVANLTITSKPQALLDCLFIMTENQHHKKTGNSCKCGALFRVSSHLARGIAMIHLLIIAGIT